MSNQLAMLLQSLSEGYYLNQVLTILGIFLFGYLFVFLLGTEEQIWQGLLAFPVGLSLWGLTGFVLLICGIPYCLTSIVIFLVIVFVILMLATQKKNRVISLRVLGLTLIGAVLISCIAVSPLLSVSVSNDTVYYYSVYPEAIVKSGFYKPSFDVFLTDVGQTTAIINCLPYFFGFDETFGIQHFFNINFCAIFFLAVYETIQSMQKNGEKEWKKPLIVAALATLFLISSTPFLITSKWVLANVYSMDFMFLIFYLGMKKEREEKHERNGWILMAILVAMFSMMRMEGGMLACLLLLCMSCLKYQNRELLFGMALPIGITQLLYYLKLFVGLKIDPLYSFLDVKKAAVMLLMVVVIIVYLLWIRNKRFPILFLHMERWMLCGLLVGNVGLLIINPSRFMTNLNCFGQNIILQNGWGYFGLIFLIYLLILPLQKGKLAYPDLFLAGYILFTIAVCWARGATLRIGIGDSGNRVMMQIVPFAVFSMTIHMGRVIMGNMRKNGGNLE